MTTLVLQGTDTNGDPQLLLAQGLLGGSALHGLANTNWVWTGSMWVQAKGKADGSAQVSYPTASLVWVKKAQAVTAPTPYYSDPFQTGDGSIIRGHLKTATAAGVLVFQWCQDNAFSTADTITDLTTQKTVGAGDEVAIKNVEPLGSWGRMRFTPSVSGTVTGELFVRPL